MAVTPTTPEATVPCLTAWLRSGNRKSLSDVEAILRDDLQEFDGVPGADNPLGRRRAVVEAVNTVCRLTHCLHTDYTTSLVAGQAGYCNAPHILKLTGLLVKRISGQWYPVPIASETAAASLKSTASYLYNAENDYQFAAAWTGAGPIRLYPTPQTDRAGALWISGWFAPGNVWEIDPTTYEPRPLDGSQECPVPDFAIPAVIAEAKRARAQNLLLLRRDLREIYPLLQADARLYIGQAETTAAQFNDLLPRSVGGYYGASYGWGAWY